MIWQRVQGHCPSCGGETLYLSQVGVVTCIAAGCANQDAVFRLLQDGETEHVVQLYEDGWTLKHPLRERIEGDLFSCPVAEIIDPTSHEVGRYRVRFVGHDPVSSSLHADLLDWERI